MFNSAVLDVVLGVVLGFLAVSLITSAIVEGVSSFFKLRSTGLLKGVQAIVNDPGFSGLARSLYEHAAINPRGTGDSGARRAMNAPATPPAPVASAADPKKNLPAYIDRQLFAAAMLDLTGLSQASATTGVYTVAQTRVAALHGALDDFFQAEQDNPQIKMLLQGIVNRTNGDIAKIKSEVAEWFDSAMDRVGGAYKRWSQWMSFFIALAVAIIFNVSTVSLGHTLWEHPQIVDQLKIPGSLQKQDATATASNATDSAQAAIAFLDSQLPVGWPAGHYMEVSSTDKDGRVTWAPLYAIGVLNFLSLFGGWVLTAIATLFGAPFWFDILQGVVRLKGSGPSPGEKVKGDAASA